MFKVMSRGALMLPIAELARRGLLLFVSVCLLFSPARAKAISATDADTVFNAFNASFYVVSNGQGYYKADTAGGRADFWKQAEMIEMIIDAYERSGNTAHRQMITESINGFIANRGNDWLNNIYNDDIMWMVIACARGYKATGNTTFRDRAKYHFDAVYSRGWDTQLGGGIWWTTDKGEKNACINGPAAIAACLLYEIYNDASYLTKAKAIYSWQKSILYDSATGKVYDHITAAGAVKKDWIFTYNQGTFIGAANYLRKITGQTSYYSDALKAANYTRNSMCTTEILPEGGTGGDGGGFTSIFLRWMGKFADENNLWGTFYPWLAQNANAAWSVRRSDNLAWCKWRTQTPAGTLAAWDCCDSVVAFQILPWEYLTVSIPYSPLELLETSFNRDVIVEKEAQGLAPSGYATASMDSTGLTGNAFFEQGYLATAPYAGLPAPGSLLVSLTAPDHSYLLPPNYSGNNAVWLSASSTTANLKPASAIPCSGLSFLNASGNGPVTISYLLRHADGSAQSGQFISPNWYGGTGTALSVQGRVNLSSGVADAVQANNPRLYSSDIPVNNRSSALTNILLTYYSGGSSAAAVILAVSAAPAAMSPQVALQPLPNRVWQGSFLAFTSSIVAVPPAALQWQRDGGTGFTNLANGSGVGGVTATNLIMPLVALEKAGTYRLVATNISGSVTSSAVSATIFSTLSNLATNAASTSFAGSSPDNESATNICDGSTSKYLNFGLNSGSGTFRGPVGVNMVPTYGPTVVSGLRFYAANDASGRDPVSYILQGSNDGTTFWFITSGTLSLPADRNAGGMGLDPIRQSVQQVLFNNTKAYASYRLSFSSIRTSSASMVQIGEVELLGVPLPELQFQKDPAAGTITLKSTYPARLWSTTNLLQEGTVWIDEGPINGSQTINMTAETPGKFFRISAP